MPIGHERGDGGGGLIEPSILREYYFLFVSMETPLPPFPHYTNNLCYGPAIFCVGCLSSLEGKGLTIICYLDPRYFTAK